MICAGRSIVQGTTFRRADHCPLCQLVHEFQTESDGLGDHDGGSSHPADAHNDSALGAALRAGIREALEPIRSSGWRILEDGRDLYKVGGRWVYLYRAVDKAGGTVDFFL